MGEMSKLALEYMRTRALPDEEARAVALALGHFADDDGVVPGRIVDGLEDGRIALSAIRCACGSLSRVVAKSLGLTIADIDAGHRCRRPAAEAGGAS